MFSIGVMVANTDRIFLDCLYSVLLRLTAYVMCPNDPKILKKGCMVLFVFWKEMYRLFFDQMSKREEVPVKWDKDKKWEEL